MPKLSWIEIPLFLGALAIVISFGITYLVSDSPYVAVRVQPTSIQPGGQLTIAASLKNLRDSPIRLTFSSSLTFDFEVSGKNGYYRWSKDKFFLMVITVVELKAGEERDITFTWTANLPPGDYQVKVFLEPMSSPRLESRAVAITIGS